MTQSTVMEAGALTVAGQWRNFTAFPSILSYRVLFQLLEKSKQVVLWTLYHFCTKNGDRTHGYRKSAPVLELQNTDRLETVPGRVWREGQNPSEVCTRRRHPDIVPGGPL
jgi:hypothetical protein